MGEIDDKEAAFIIHLLERRMFKIHLKSPDIVCLILQ